MFKCWLSLNGDLNLKSRYDDLHKGLSMDDLKSEFNGASGEVRCNTLGPD